MALFVLFMTVFVLNTTRIFFKAFTGIVPYMTGAALNTFTYFLNMYEILVRMTVLFNKKNLMDCYMS